jgi:arsenate reductase-like glutaredoxin family protein
MKMKESNNCIIRTFRKTKCKNDLFKKWDEELDHEVDELFKEKTNESKQTNDSGNHVSRRQRLKIDITKFE